MLTKINKPIAPFLPHIRAVYSEVLKRSGLLASRLKRYLVSKDFLFAGGVALSLVAATYISSLSWPRALAFSYAQDNCFTNPVLLPNLISRKQSPTYSATPTTSLAVAGYPVFSRTTCVTPTQPPQEHVTEVITFGTALLQKNIQVSAGAFPVLAAQAVLDKPVSTLDPLILDLNSPDRVFEYQLEVGDQSLACTKAYSAVECNLAELGLAQSAKYDFKLKRLFGGSPVGTIFEHSLATVESVQVTGSSIGAEQTVYNVPSELTLTINRSAVSMEGVHLHLVNGDARQEVAATATLNDKTITVRFQQPLARNASFVFSLERVKAADGGFLSAPFALNFKTSGGPKVVGLNIGSYKVSLSGNIVITFDSPVSKTQALGEFVRLEAAGSPVRSTISAYNNTLTINPHAALPRCAPLTVRVLDGLQNDFGIAGGSAWQFKSRSICQQVFSIGTSVRGRSITAYRFGSGATKIIAVGATHGDERSSTYTLQAWINDLELNYDSIPAHISIIIIPTLNPDGFAAGTRVNANNVDLNRNFPANDWKQGVTMPNGSYNANGGGSEPLSEPESRAMANYVLSVQPQLVLTYHAVAGLVIANDSGNSRALATIYGQKSGLSAMGNSESEGTFNYDTTGAFENWLHDQPGIPALLIELWSYGGNEFYSHRAAMWAMLD